MYPTIYSVNEIIKEATNFENISGKLQEFLVETIYFTVAKYLKYELMFYHVTMSFHRV